METKVHLNGSLHACWVVQALPPPVRWWLEIRRAAPQHRVLSAQRLASVRSREGKARRKRQEELLEHVFEDVNPSQCFFLMHSNF